MENLIVTLNGSKYDDAGNSQSHNLISYLLKKKHLGWNTKVKFIYSEKATKILRNLHLFLTGTSVSQKKVEILQKICGLLRIYEFYESAQNHVT